MSIPSETSKNNNNNNGGFHSNIIITGGGGFLGQCLATQLLNVGSVQSNTGDTVPIHTILLADIFFPDTLQPAVTQGISTGTVQTHQGDVSDPTYCHSLYTSATTTSATATTITHLSVFHLGAVMSGDGERDFDLCLRVNLTGFLHMVEGARRCWDRASTRPSNGLVQPVTFLLASAGATIGSGAPTDYVTSTDVLSDATRATPHTTYGTTKACAEVLLSDYSRRGYVDGRGVRLPTIVVRAGAPNAATTSCFSAVVRDVLAGGGTATKDGTDGGTVVALPIAKTVPHAVTGYADAIRAMIHLHNVSLTDIETVLGFDRTVFLPSIALSLGDLHAAVLTVVAPSSHGRLADVEYVVDERLSNIVAGFPTRIDASRAERLGVPRAPSAEEMVRTYIKDFGEAVVPGLEFTTRTTKESSDDGGVVAKQTSTNVDAAGVAVKVAVVTGAGSGIGQAVAIRLSRAGYAVVLAGRRLESLQETVTSLEGRKSTCVATDVTKEADVEHLFATAESEYGRVDLLFNNAGMNSEAASIEHVNVDDFRRVLDTNVCGMFLCAKAAMTIMGKEGHGGGRIINNGSISSHVPRPGSACYTTSKHAVLGLTKCIALDGRALKVACGQIDFGNVVSEMSLRTNKPGSGAMQPNGTTLVEPAMSLVDAAETVMAMVNLPLEANILNMTCMATTMPFVGRG